MDPVATYDYLTLARERIFDRVRPLGEADYARVFPIGPGSIATTLTHVMISEWYYVQRLLERDVPPYDDWPIRDEEPPPFDSLESTWTQQARSTRDALGAARDWDARIEFQVTRDGEPIIVTATDAGLLTQLVLHEVHHRAQVLNMLRHLGVPAEDLDFNALTFQRRPA